MSDSGQRTRDPRAAQNLSDSLAKPSVARVYDYILGGGHNYAVDREFAERQLALMPDMRAAMVANRAFLGRAVRYAAERGIYQFVDIGSGLPSVNPVHEVAEETAPGASRVVYIDNEPIAHAHAEILLARDADPARHRALCADFLDHDDLWEQVLATGVIDQDRPICLLVVALLHFMQPEQEPERVMAHYRERLPSGSTLVLTHACDELNGEDIQQVAANYSATTNSAMLRSRAEFREFFGDFPLVDPGLVWVPEWRLDGPLTDEWAANPARSRYLGGVGCKP